MNIKTNVLLVEDDSNLGMILTDFLEMKNYTVTRVLNGEDGLKKMMNGFYVICILDIMLPQMDGFTLLEEIRRKNKTLPIILLTAKSLSEDKIKGLKMGADDYITKPFNLEEMELRVQAVLKRQVTMAPKKAKVSSILKIGELRLDLRNRVLKHNEIELDLTNKEVELLKLLVENKNLVVSREMAFKLIWDKDFEADSSSRSLDVYIVKLRKYLQSDPSINILNVHGSGYKLVVGK